MTRINCGAADLKDAVEQARSADISVIVVTYNHEAFIAQAIESVLAQSTDRLLEVIISEDKSTDRTRDIVEDYERRDKRIRLMLSERNVCSNEVVARALRSAAGRYVCILDGDDYWLTNNKLEQQAHFLDANPDYSAVFHNALIEDTFSAGRRWTRPDLPKMFTLNQIWQGNPFATCAGMLRRNCLEGLDSWYDELFPITDWSLYILCAERGPIAFVDEVVGAYRHHPSGEFSALSTREKMDRTSSFYRRMGKTGGASRRAFAKEGCSLYFFEWATVYAGNGQPRLGWTCLWRSVKGGGIGRSVSWVDACRLAIRLAKGGLH
ncbi:glycosyltransferase family 2 protein [Bradyrhizobium sp. LLZ17]|uniref:Glycosyltransferase family 2 protein n=1 Tax=Bradyrhizobium sp. LLZ17 TaxID=3239388 RepID=A0AB39XRX9_9BRAD